MTDDVIPTKPELATPPKPKRNSKYGNLAAQYKAEHEALKAFNKAEERAARARIFLNKHSYTYVLEDGTTSKVFISLESCFANSRLDPNSRASVERVRERLQRHPRKL